MRFSTPQLTLEGCISKYIAFHPLFISQRHFKANDIFNYVDDKQTLFRNDDIYIFLYIFNLNLNRKEH